MRRSYRQSSKLCRYPILEKTLFAYIMKKRDIGVTISRKFIQMTARKIGQSMNLSRFTASNGWLENFLIRNKLSLRRITSTGRALPRNTPIIVTDHLRKMAKLGRIYSKSEILNMDETNIQLDYPSKFYSIFIFVLLKLKNFNFNNI